jgi:hypothetical protein
LTKVNASLTGLFFQKWFKTPLYNSMNTLN